MKLDLNFLIKGLDGSPLNFPGAKPDDVHAGAIVAHQLAFARVQSPLSPLKRMSLAQKLYERQPVEVTTEEAGQIKDLVSNFEGGLPPNTIAQVIEVIAKASE